MLLLALVPLCIMLAGCSPFGTDCDEYTFDRQAWVEDDPMVADAPPDGGRRPRLAEQLVECGTLTGASKQQVISQLGKPFAREDDRELWTYPLGTPDGLTEMDDLHVEFNDRDRVVSVDSTLD